MVWSFQHRAPNATKQKCDELAKERVRRGSKRGRLKMS